MVGAPAFMRGQRVSVEANIPCSILGLLAPASNLWLSVKIIEGAYLVLDLRSEPRTNAGTPIWFPTPSLRSDSIKSQA